MNFLQRLMMPDCNRVRKVLQSYLDGELDDDNAAFVAAHLEHCERCGIEADIYERVKASLAELHQAPDPSAVDRLRRFAESVPAAEADGHDQPPA